MTTFATPPATPATTPTAPTASAADAAATSPAAHSGFLRDLDDPRRALSHVGPNWFTVVMGTGIVAVAAASLPLQAPWLRDAATVVWALAALLLVVVVAATVAHWVRFPQTARSHALDTVMAHSYGAVPMAFLTVGAGTLLLGQDVIGTRASVATDGVLWVVGTLLGVGTTVAVPFLAFTRHEVRDDSAFPGWLMPVVPPMVSATTGALLLPHVPAGQLRLTMLVACGALFGASLLATFAILPLVWQRFARHKVGAASAAPTVWIVLGPLGQSVTAAGMVATASAGIFASPEARVLTLVAAVFGVAVWGFAMVWLAIAIAITVRTARAGMPFGLAWWSFTFPLGTCVTGTSQLWLHTGADVFGAVAVVLYVGLVGAWAVVGVRTLRGAWTGRLLVPAAG